MLPRAALRCRLGQREHRSTSTGILEKIPEAAYSLLSPETSFLDDVVAACELGGETRLLDIGCGTGALLVKAAFYEPGATLYGVDPDDDHLELAREKTGSSVASIKLLKEFGESLPFEDESFDVVTATLVLSSVPERVSTNILTEALRILRPGGRLLAADWCHPDSVWLNLLTLPGRLALSLMEGHAKPFSERQLASQLSLAGYVEVERLKSYRGLTGEIDLVRGEKP